MNYLERLDIHPKVQSFFTPYLKIACETLIFGYGNSYEHAGTNFHKVPVTEAFWQAGNPAMATDLFICGSAMDALIWLHIHQWHYRRFDTLCFMAIGTTPTKYHAEIIERHAPKKKLHFIFSKDDLGVICDLKLASFIRNKPLQISYHENLYRVIFENKYYEFEALSLNALEKASGYNFRIRTHKPKKNNTYYEQFRNRHPA